jgi:hypothetical protein
VPRPQCLAVRCRAATVLDAALGTIEKLSVVLTKKGRQCFSQWQITVISIVFTIGKGHGIVKKSSCVLSTELFWGIVFYIMCGILLCLGITVSGMYLHHMNLILYVKVYVMSSHQLPKISSLVHQVKTFLAFEWMHMSNWDATAEKSENFTTVYHCLEL